MSRKPSAFLETIIAFLLPHFAAAATDAHDARSEIIDTLAAYATRTRAELLQAAQIIAFGMTTLDVLAEAKTAEMSASMRIRFRGCANGLNRSTMQAQQALDQRLACDVPMAPEITQPRLGNLSDTEVPATTQPPRASTDRQRDPLLVNGTRPVSQQERNRQAWAGAMIDTLQQMGIAVQPPQGG